MTEQSLRQQRLALLRDELSELEAQLEQQAPAAQESLRCTEAPVFRPFEAGPALSVSPEPAAGHLPPVEEAYSRPIQLPRKARRWGIFNFWSLAAVCSILLLTMARWGFSGNDNDILLAEARADQTPDVVYVEAVTPPAPDLSADAWQPSAADLLLAATTETPAKPTPSPTAVTVSNQPVAMAILAAAESTDWQFDVVAAPSVTEQIENPTNPVSPAQPISDVMPTPTAAPVIMAQPEHTATSEAPATARSTALLTPAAPGVLCLAESIPPTLASVLDRYQINLQQRFLVVDQDAQQMIVCDPGEPLRVLAISTGGADGYITPPWSGRVGWYVGTISSFNTFADHAWYLFQSLDSILIHGLPYRIIDNHKVYEGSDALGVEPVSHGCIRLSPEDARWLTAWNPYNVQIAILPFSANVEPEQFSGKE